jgi:cytochrome c553
VTKPAAAADLTLHHGKFTTLARAHSMAARRTLACITVALAGTWGHAKAADSGRIGAGQEFAAHVCSACHGLDGNAPNAQFPKLAGR